MKKIGVVEVAMEMALTPSILRELESRYGLFPAIVSAMSTSVGGIGPLLRERIIAQKRLGIDVIGVSLLYERVWVQRWHFWGQFYLEQNEASAYIKTVLRRMDFDLEVEFPNGQKIKVSVWEAEYEGAKVYFLSSPQITNIVYPGPEDAPLEAEDPYRWVFEQKLHQSWLLGRGTLSLLKRLKVKPDIIVLSETPTIFAVHKLVEDEYCSDPLFGSTKYIFNDHTPLEYAHPVWSEEVLRRFKVRKEFYEKLPTYREDPNKVDVTQLVINLADSVYGVSKIHGDVMRNMPTLRPYADKIKTITNGISLDFWQAEVFRDYKNKSPEELLEIKQKEKEKLIEWMWRRYKFGSEWRIGKKVRPLVMWMRRVTGYKRLDILKEALQRDDTRQRFIKLGVVFFIGGRIHQNDATSDRVVFDLMDIVERYPELENQVYLLENFNILEAPFIFCGVDAAVMISNKGREASATGFMKAQSNGTMIIAVEDGAIPESVVFFNREGNNENANGFYVGYVNGYPTVETFLDALEDFVYVYHNKELRARMIRNSLLQTEKVDIMNTAECMLELYKDVLGMDSKKK